MFLHVTISGKCCRTAYIACWRIEYASGNIPLINVMKIARLPRKQDVHAAEEYRSILQNKSYFCNNYPVNRFSQHAPLLTRNLNRYHVIFLPILKLESFRGQIWIICGCCVGVLIKLSSTVGKLYPIQIFRKRNNLLPDFD